MLRSILFGLLAILLIAGAALTILAIHDSRDAGRLVRGLLAGRDPAPPLFDPSMTEGLPEIARRYFAHAIAPGTPLSRVVELRMEGEFLLNGSPLVMSATQVLRAPDGFVWQAGFGRGAMRIGGSDALDGSESWTRFGLFGLLPLARAGGNEDHRRAAGTRALMEAVWAPAALLPQFGAIWEQTGPDTARVSIPALRGVAPMEVTLAEDGAVLSLTAMRWSDANPEHAYRLQPFGGRVLESRRFGGFTIPARVELGNHWGTAAFDGFFRATITSARW
jgi:hypothetical protein